MKVGDCMNVWRSTDPCIYNMQWTDGDNWWHREGVDDIARAVERDNDDIRRVAVIRIKSIKEKQA